ncbi:GNAT family N-acetyltransferase [Paractinoplanes globisporus]|uniref:GNAT family N-acetyltransferase n=1 Tax=Paractinoplanes globisporus TaxID=113565 RepID=A0ABW6WUN8_9ACTN|nr:GNAT family N-acetyltransferase [Actinoplanes globisporus]
MLRPATDDDLDAMHAWRNQPPNREVSINSHEITPGEHAAWWSRTRTDPSRQVLIYERDGVPSGVVNFFDLSAAGPGRTGSWGFFLDTAGLGERGETLPAWLEVMREAADHAFDTLGLDELTGEVLADNVVVRQMNRRFRFVEGEPESREADGRTITVIPISLKRENRRRRQPQ